MQYTSVEQTYAPVDTSTSSDASEAMSRGSHGFSLWDDEQHRTTGLTQIQGESNIIAEARGYNHGPRCFEKRAGYLEIRVPYFD